MPQCNFDECHSAVISPQISSCCLPARRTPRAQRS